MYKHKLLLLPVALLLAFMAFACAPPDDDDAPSSGPTINKAIYDVGTALLTLQGTNLSPTTATQAQIQTIKVYGVAFSSYTADDPATGEDSSDLAKGKYRIANDGTALWLKLKDEHKVTLNGKTGMDSNGRKDGLLTSTGAWAGLNTAKDLVVKYIPDKQSKVSDDNQPSKQTEDEQDEDQSPKQPKDEQDEQDEDQSPKQPKDEQDEQDEDQSPKQPKDEQDEQDEDQSPKQPKDEQVEQVEDQSPKQPKDEQDEQDEDQSPKQPKDEQVEQVEEESPEAAITRASYNVTSGFLVITGVNLPAAVTGWDFSKLTLVSGDRTNRFTLPKHSTLVRNTAIGSSASATKLFIFLRGSVKVKADKILVKDGVRDANGAYNLEAAAGFAGGNAADTTNPITVSGHTTSITKAQYDSNTGVLLIQGIKLPKTVTDWDFSKLTLVSGDGTNRYTLPQHATAGENTASGSNASATSLTITLSGSIKAEAEKILVKDGVRDANGAYNLEAAAGFVPGNPADTSNPITVSGYVSQINSVIYRTRGLLLIYGSRLPTAVADWDFSKLTLVSGDGSKRFTLPQHATEGANKATGSRAIATSLTITLSGSVKAKVNAILVKAGLGDANGAYNLEAAAGFAGGSTEDPTTGIQVTSW